MKLYTQALLGAALVGFTAAAAALPISGGGSFVANAPNSGYDANSVTFGTSPNPSGDNAQIKATSGNYANLFAFNDTVEFYDFIYNPYSGTKKIWDGSGSLNPTNMQFFLKNVSSGSLNSSTNQFIISGTGFIRGGTLGDGVDVMWSFTGNQATRNNFSWSASISVPEPGTLVLLGIGLAGLGVARRRQRA
ncbi:PEP-CTERM sorting domain-containing protein [Marinobacter changyiensis]|uniref:PEP-CTERM sorting domain-containing protein n=1 Tax=Marinobacter changyiensis TaxID=2604091 RepID=UPI001FE419A5|nr:PEP-CTERM sorting domain-containing protein [Marinobacter changyiensis]